MVNGKDNVKRDRLKEPDRTKYELYDILKTEVGRCGNWNVLVANLKRHGEKVLFSHRRHTNAVQGVAFTKNDNHFNGSKVDKRFSYSKIGAALRHSRREERMGLTINVHEAVIPNAASSSYNAVDAEAYQEIADILRRKKRRRKMRL